MTDTEQIHCKLDIFQCLFDVLSRIKYQCFNGLALCYFIRTSQRLALIWLSLLVYIEGLNCSCREVTFGIHLLLLLHIIVLLLLYLTKLCFWFKEVVSSWYFYIIIKKTKQYIAYWVLNVYFKICYFDTVLNFVLGLKVLLACPLLSLILWFNWLNKFSLYLVATKWIKIKVYLIYAELLNC